MPLIYSFVARGTCVLAEYTPYSGNFNTVAIECLQKLNNPESKFTIACDRHTFNFLVHNGFSECGERATRLSGSLGSAASVRVSVARSACRRCPQPRAR